MSRGDSPMNCRWAWMLPVLSIVTMLLSDSGAHAQGPMPPGGPGGPPPGMMGPPGMGGPGMGPGMGGGPGMYDPDSMGGMGMMGPGDGSCPPGMDGGMGGPGGPGHNGLLGDILGIIAPYGDGGCAAPRWFDIDIGVLSLKRDNTGRNIDFATIGTGGAPPLPDATTLSLDDLDFDYSTSVKFTAMLQWGPGSDVEFTYYGLFGWTEQASVAGAGNIQSVYDNFNPLGGFEETSNADAATIRYFSTFDNYEVNFRQRWQSPNCRYQGSWLAGVRYFQLDEDFNYRIDKNDPGNFVGSTITNVNTNNALTGLQFGGDVWICLIPGLRIGGEGKFAVLGNHANIDSVITVNNAVPPVPPAMPPGPFADGSVVGDVAFLGDVAAYVTYRINYHWTLKGGIQALYLDGAALAADNFNPVAPNIFAGGAAIRQPVRNENGDVFWHGYTMSLEYLW